MGLTSNAIGFLNEKDYNSYVIPPGELRLLMGMKRSEKCSSGGWQPLEHANMPRRLREDYRKGRLEARLSSNA